MVSSAKTSSVLKLPLTGSMIAIWPNGTRSLSDDAVAIVVDQRIGIVAARKKAPGSKLVDSSRCS
jgi:hypothetical protein